MADPIQITECLGWEPSVDQLAVLVGLKAANGWLTLEMDEAATKEMIFNLVQALGTFKKPKAQSGERLVIDANWIDIGLSRDKKDALLSLRFSNGGELAFRFPRSLGERFLDTLDTVLDPDSNGSPPPGEVSH